MKVLITSARINNPQKELLHTAAYEKLWECAHKDCFGVHHLVSSPEDADIILFAELDGLGCHFSDRLLLRHEYVKKYYQKCFLYTPVDKPIAFLPGLYSSIEQRYFDPARIRSCHYLSTHITKIPFKLLPYAKKDLLFSFVGSVYTHPIRAEIVKIIHPRGLCHDVSQGGQVLWYQQQGAFSKYIIDYAELMSRSRFVLCPRGVGTSSIRLFEAMECGAVPVIISDSWIPPTGPNWEKFSLRIPENQIAEIPSIIESYEHRSEEMGQLARQAWENWFADEVSFHRMVEWCIEIMATKQQQGINKALQLNPYVQQLIRPYHLRVVLSEAKKILTSK
ncbi:glycosyltransferase family 47 protein [Nostoc sp. CHAB 5844]|nr:glycosyltransferase family 47 protein [Nostoc sp. CHAB 5844]